MNDTPPRRANMHLMSPAELAILSAQMAVERAGADVRLTDACVLLAAARERVADFVDGVEGEHTFPMHAPANNAAPIVPAFEALVRDIVTKEIADALGRMRAL